MSGDVIVAPGGGDGPLYVVRCEPGPNQFGCTSLAAATRLARAFAATAGVDVWLADRSGRVTVLARFRGLGGTAAPPARIEVTALASDPDATVQDSTRRPMRPSYSGGGAPRGS